MSTPLHHLFTSVPFAPKPPPFRTTLFFPSLKLNRHYPFRFLQSPFKASPTFLPKADDALAQVGEPDGYGMDVQEINEVDNYIDYHVGHGPFSTSAADQDIVMVDSKSCVSTHGWQSEKIVDYRIRGEHFHNVSLMGCDSFIRKPPDRDNDVYNLRDFYFTPPATDVYAVPAVLSPLRQKDAIKHPRRGNPSKSQGFSLSRMFCFLGVTTLLNVETPQSGATLSGKLVNDFEPSDATEMSEPVKNFVQRLTLVDLDPATAKLAIGFLGPFLSAFSLLFIFRIVMSWYPKLPVGKFPYVIAYAPTEPLLVPTRKLIPPLGGVDVTPVVWFGLLSFLNEILVGPQGLLVLLSQQLN